MPFVFRLFNLSFYLRPLPLRCALSIAPLPLAIALLSLATLQLPLASLLLPLMTPPLPLAISLPLLALLLPFSAFLPSSSSLAVFFCQLASLRRWLFVHCHPGFCLAASGRRIDFAR